MVDVLFEVSILHTIDIDGWGWTSISWYWVCTGVCVLFFSGPFEFLTPFVDDRSIALREVVHD